MDVGFKYVHIWEGTFRKLDRIMETYLPTSLLAEFWHFQGSSMTAVTLLYKEAATTLTMHPEHWAEPESWCTSYYPHHQTYQPSQRQPVTYVFSRTC